MSVNEKLCDRIRECLVDFPDLEEKKMFSGMAFLINGKMCICVRAHNAMFRVDPAIYIDAVERAGASSMMMKGKECIGYINVTEEALKPKKELDYWIGLALAFNPHARAARKKKK